MQIDLFAEPLRFERLSDLVAALEGLEEDPLAKHGTNVVVYRGNPEAELMLIGEGPGAEEDRLGKPFVGRSGKLLDQILSAAGIDPEREAFVTNSVFRRPPGNRKPTTEEIEYYRPYLMEILRLVDPAVVILVGGVAVQSILDDKRGITKIRGQWFEWNGRRVMPMFHPAYLLRNPSRNPGSPKALTWADIQSVKARLDALEVDASSDAAPTP